MGRGAVAGIAVLLATACGTGPQGFGDGGADADGDHHGVDGDDGDDGDGSAVICAATDGGRGGDAGGVLVLVALDPPEALELREQLEDFVVGGPGAGGLGGAATIGPPASDGPPGAVDDTLTVAGDSGWTFDASDIDPAWVIDVGSNEATVTLPELSDPPDVVVSELRVRSGSSLTLSCDARLAAERVVVESGATLGFRGRNHSGCAWTFGGTELDPGARGGAVWLETRSLELHGTLDLAGTDGAPGGPGGAGGTLTLRTETITLGDDAAIVVAGGEGGDGLPEMPCGVD